MNKVKDDFFLHSNKVGHISKEDYDKIELLVNAAKAFARSTYQCVYIIDYFHQDFIYASDNLAYLCGLVAKTEHSHPLGMVVSTHFRCGKGVKRGLKNGALPFNID